MAIITSLAAILFGIVAVGADSQSMGFFPTSQTLKWDGIWGSWGAAERCPEKSYVTTFKVQVEPYQCQGQGNGCDDTGMNSICLTCSSGHVICSQKGKWGNWYQANTCSQGFGGARFKLEGNQGDNGDDTAGNGLEMECGSYTHNYFQARNVPAGWGSWSYKRCPFGSVICGLKTRIEPYQGDRVGDDDSALNGVEFQCCVTVKRVTVYLDELYKVEGDSSGTFERELEVTYGLTTSEQLDYSESTSIASHVGASVNYGAISADASVDVTILRSASRSTLTTTERRKKEIQKITIDLSKPSYIYQPRSVIVLSDDTTIHQGSNTLIQQSSPISNEMREVTVYRKTA